MTAAKASFQLSQPSADVLGVSGVLTFDNAEAAWQVLRKSVHGSQATRLDLAAVERSDSAGLACVLALLAEAQQQGRTLHVSHPPAGMHALATVCAVDHLLV
jgi:phospholipid transport system transporter-binding protein